MKKTRIIAFLLFFTSYLILSFCMINCQNYRSKSIPYDYYYLQYQSIYYFNHQDQSTSLLLSIPETYEILKMTLSPSQKTFAFTVKKDSQTILFFADADGSNMRRITQGLWLQFSWSPTNDQLCYIKMEENASYLYLLSEFSSNPELVTQADFFEWSPHGLYICLIQKYEQHTESFILRNDNTGLRFISHDKFLGWSSDGQFMYYYHELDDDNYLQVVQYDGTLWDTFHLNQPQQIKFRNSPTTNATFFHINKDSMPQVMAYYPHEKKWELPSDQSLMNFFSSPFGAEKWELYIESVETIQKLILFSNQVEQDLLQGEYIEFISFSPDEMQLICSNKTASHQTVYYVNPKDKMMELVGSAEQVGQIAWHPDSTRFAIHLDQALLLFSMEKNIIVKLMDNASFISWKKI